MVAVTGALQSNDPRPPRQPPAFVVDAAVMIEFRGNVRAATGDPEAALADWRRALALNPDNLSPLYSSAFLLEREGRLQEAVGAWSFIIERCDAEGWELTADWPRRELERLRGELPSPSA
jgi:tetratricopeptide (TPR) repeat protein